MHLAKQIIPAVIVKLEAINLIQKQAHHYVTCAKMVKLYKHDLNWMKEQDKDSVQHKFICSSKEKRRKE